MPFWRLRLDGGVSHRIAHSSERAPGQKFSLHSAHFMGQSTDKCLPVAPQLEQTVAEVSTGRGLVPGVFSSVLSRAETSLDALARSMAISSTSSVNVHGGARPRFPEVWGAVMLCCQVINELKTI